jgi:hypothetical protein
LDQVDFSAITYANTELARFIVLHDDLQHLMLVVEDLVHSQLTPRLVSISVLTEALKNVTRALSGRFKEPCLTSPNELYTTGNHDFARYGRDLFIQLYQPDQAECLSFAYASITSSGRPWTHLPTERLVSIRNNKHSGHNGKLQELPRFPVTAADDVAPLNRHV